MAGSSRFPILLATAVMLALMVCTLGVPAARAAMCPQRSATAWSMGRMRRTNPFAHKRTGP